MYPLLPLYDFEFRKSPILNKFSIWHVIFDTFDYFQSSTKFQMIDAPVSTILALPLRKVIQVPDSSHWSLRHRNFAAGTFLVFDEHQQRLRIRVPSEFSRFPRLCQTLANDIICTRTIKLEAFVWPHILAAPAPTLPEEWSSLSGRYHCSSRGGIDGPSRHEDLSQQYPKAVPQRLNCQTLRQLTSHELVSQMRLQPLWGQFNPTVLRSSFKKKSAPILTNLFEEYGVLDPRQWSSGVAYDSIHYLGDLSTLQFFSNKIDEQGTFQGHKIKKIGGNVVLVADPGEPGPSKIPVFHLPEDMHSGEDIHKYIYTTVTEVDRYTAVRLFKIYFSHIYPILPVINKTEFLKQHRDRVDTYPPGELLNALLHGLSNVKVWSHIEKKKLPADAIWDVPVGWSNHFFDQAEYIISKWSNLQTVTNVQAIIIILNHRGDRDSKSSACWQLGGYAIRLIYLAFIDRVKTGISQKKEKETRNRAWWALYITDRFQTAILGRPINLRDEDINVPYPDPGADIEEVLDAFEADKDRILNNEVLPRSPCLTAPYNYKTNSNREWPQIYELFVQFIKLSEILGRILQGLHTPKAKKFSSQHGSDGLVTRLDYELTQWRNEFPKALKKIQLPDFNEDVGHFAPVIASMLMFYCSSLILLHQPFIQKTSQSKSSHTSLQICTSAAIRGIRIACRLAARDFLTCPYSFTLCPLRQFGLIHNVLAIDDKYLDDSMVKLPKTLRHMLKELVQVSKWSS
ncbi:fungal-specific transcription factor domain-containing protein [Mucor mucedo]|uniref:fungal-specific transcription factor domain-containing protein n=1 Tax=Mucor mucedo TaxID=29922 RepID=UPI00221FDD54|nr:fungal-specific transcription factor domain-containing protein [Mucor mucedo]KAI7889502.1 fungal-specific transcription factor domain-containing protein [Mucor mucedo]